MSGIDIIISSQPTTRNVKFCDLYPVFSIIAKQNKLNMKKLSDLKKIERLYLRSICNN